VKPAPPNRVLIAHNRYRSAWPSGEDLVFDAEVELLRAHGHTVETFERTSDDIRGALGTARAARDSVWSRDAARDLGEQIARFRPDVVHFHNTFPLISGAAVRAAHASGAAVVATLHNYRLVCAAGTLFRDGEPCELCLPMRLPWPALRYGCYRESRVATAPLVAAQVLHEGLRTWITGVDRFICLTELAREKLVAGGIPAKRTRVRGHFLHPVPAAATEHDGPAVFLGRLDEAKGAALLFEAWRELPQVPLLVVGDGPLREALETSEVGRRDNVTFTGLQPHARCLELLSGASMLVFPSLVYETFGLALRDAMALGKAVVATDRGSARELVREGETGLHFRAGDAASLAATVRRLSADSPLRARLGEAGRREFMARFQAETSYSELRTIYEEAMAYARSRGAWDVA
jgi:glycosyltransferase involved in cell wall biosynthesis